MSNLQCSVRGVYPLLGNIGEDQLPLEVVLPLFHSVVTKRLNQMAISNNNWFTKPKERTVTVQDSLLNIEDFGSPVQVEVLVNSGSYYPIWKPIRIATLESLNDFREDSTLAVAFYGIGDTRRMRFSRPHGLPGLIRIWYEPFLQLENGFRSENPIPENLLPLVNFETAILAAPHIKDVTPEQRASASLMIENYRNEVAQWDGQFKTFINPLQLEHRAYAKRRYSRNRFGGNR